MVVCDVGSVAGRSLHHGIEQGNIVTKVSPPCAFKKFLFDEATWLLMLNLITRI